jgi:pyrimidine operon attenuation protein/uracil phosphoribosyltransferase
MYLPSLLLKQIYLLNVLEGGANMVQRIEEQTKPEEKVNVQEVEINLTLINNKLNYLINLLEKS